MGTQAGRGDLFFRNRIPCGAQSKTQWALESGTCLFDSAGVKRAAHWPGLTSQSQHRKCLADLNVRAPNLFWLPGNTASPGSAVGSNDGCKGAMTLVLRMRSQSRGLSLWAFRPGRRSWGKHTRSQQAVERARRYPGLRPPACCLDPVSCSCSFEESCEGSSPPRQPQEGAWWQTVVNAPRRRRHRGD